MVSIRKEFIVRREPATVWAQLRDFGNVHRALAIERMMDVAVKAMRSRLEQPE
jgi:carbon monoxide dehydrogenase subunit G